MHFDRFHVRVVSLSHPLDVLIRTGKDRLGLFDLGVGFPLEVLGQVVLHQDWLVVAVENAD